MAKLLDWTRMRGILGFLASAAVFTKGDKYEDLCFHKSMPKDLEKREKLYKKVDEYMRKVTTEHNIQGCSVAISVHGNVKLLYSRGMQDQALQVRSSPDTVANVGQISKFLLGFLAMKMLNNREEQDPRIKESLLSGEEILTNYGIPLKVLPPLPNALLLEKGDSKWGYAMCDEKDQPIFTPLVSTSSNWATDVDIELENKIYECVPERRYIESKQKYPIDLLSILYQKSGLKSYHLKQERFPQESIYKGDLYGIIENIRSFLLEYRPGNIKVNSSPSSPNGCEAEVLALVLSSLENEDYKDYIDKQLIKLNLTNTKLQLPNEIFINKNRGARALRTGSRFEVTNSGYVDYRDIMASYGLCSSVRDLDKLINIVMKCITNDMEESTILPNQKWSRLLLNEDMKMSTQGFPGYNVRVNQHNNNVVQTKGIFNQQEHIQVFGANHASTHRFQLSSIYQVGMSSEASSIVMASSRVDGYKWNIVEYTDDEYTQVYEDIDRPHFLQYLSMYYNQTKKYYRPEDSTLEGGRSPNKFKYVTVSMILNNRLMTSSDEEKAKETLVDIARKLTSFYVAEYCR